MFLGPFFYVTWFLPLLNTSCLQGFQIRKQHPKLQPPKANAAQAVWPGWSWSHGMIQVVTYAAPLMLLDVTLRKYYDGVDLAEWAAQPYIGFQLSRLLPAEPPTAREVVGHTFAALLVYDAIFFFLHFALHTFPWLYAAVHKHHHDHETVAHHGALQAACTPIAALQSPSAPHCAVTNQLTLAERVFLILSANAALKLVRAHPLTRNVFTHCFIWLLMDSHSGMDFPVWYDKVLPIFGGSLAHYTHHVRHSTHFAPLFAHLDWLAGTVFDWQALRSEAA